MRLFVDEFECC